jgi:hypothetical protein
MGQKHIQSKRKRKTSRSERRRKRGTHRNKYGHLAPKIKNSYDPYDKRFRDLPVFGNPGEKVPAGLVILFHGRRYRLLYDVIIPRNTNQTMGKFKLF